MFSALRMQLSIDFPAAQRKVEGERGCAFARVCVCERLIGGVCGGAVNKGWGQRRGEEEESKP